MNDSLEKVLAELKNKSIAITLTDKNRIKYEGLSENLSDELLLNMKENKEEIITYLKTIDRINVEENASLVKKEPETCVRIMPEKYFRDDTHIEGILKVLDKEMFVTGERQKEMTEYIEFANKISINEIYLQLRNLGLFSNNVWYPREEIIAAIAPTEKYISIVDETLKMLIENDILSEENLKYKAKVGVITSVELSELWDIFEGLDRKLNNNNLFTSYLKEAIKNFLNVLKGKVRAIDLLFPKGNTEFAKTFYGTNALILPLNKYASSLMKRMTSVGYDLSIIELGGGVGGTTNHILNSLIGSEYKYLFTDVSVFFTNDMEKQYANQNVSVKKLDINQFFIENASDYKKFDVVICSNVLHNSTNIDLTLNTMKYLLKKNGIFVIIEQVEDYHYLLSSLKLNFYSNLSDTHIISAAEWRNILKNNDAKIINEYPKESNEFGGMKIFIGGFNSHYEIDISSLDIYMDIEYKTNEYMICSDIAVQKHSLGKEEENNMGMAVSSTQLSDYEQFQGIFKNVLELDELNDDSDFFELGGDSLVMTKLISLIWQGFPDTKKHDWKSMSEKINEQKTVKKIYEKLFEKQKNNIMTVTVPKTNIIKMREHIPDKTFVFIHDGTGTLEKYEHLINKLWENSHGKVVIYGIKYDTDLKSNPEIKEIKDVAYIYSKTVIPELNRLKDSKIVLVGHCIGGSIAFEMSKILKEKYGLKIFETIIINSFLNVNLVKNGKNNAYITSCLESDYLLSLLFSDILYPHINLDINKDKILRHINNEEELIIKADMKQSSLPVDVFNLVKESFCMVSNYIPSYYDGRVCIINAKIPTKNNFLESQEDFNSNISLWQKYLDSEHRFYSVDATHTNILDSYNSNKICNIIEREVYE